MAPFTRPVGEGIVPDASRRALYDRLLEDYRALGGHMDDVRDLGVVGEKGAVQVTEWRQDNPWPFGPDGEAD